MALLQPPFNSATPRPFSLVSSLCLAITRWSRPPLQVRSPQTRRRHLNPSFPWPARDQEEAVGKGRPGPDDSGSGPQLVVVERRCTNDLSLGGSTGLRYTDVGVPRVWATCKFCTLVSSLPRPPFRFLTLQPHVLSEGNPKQEEPEPGKESPDLAFVTSSLPTYFPLTPPFLRWFHSHLWVVPAVRADAPDGAPADARGRSAGRHPDRRVPRVSSRARPTRPPQSPAQSPARPPPDAAGGSRPGTSPGFRARPDRPLFPADAGRGLLRA